ncbi:MAG: LLM class flavin-dependent oxidoreductase, partial [Acidimicrobiales bacterium]
CATHGVDLDTAGGRLFDHLALMRELWQHEEGSHRGEYCAVEPSWAWPKPVQQPSPPVHVGARATDAVFADIAMWADGWMPIEGYGDVVGHLHGSGRRSSTRDVSRTMPW